MFQSLIEQMMPHLEALEAQSESMMSSLTIAEAPKPMPKIKQPPLEKIVSECEEKAIDEGFDYVMFPELNPDE